MFLSETGNIVYISTDFGHRNSDRNGYITLDRRRTDIVNIIASGIIGPRNPPLRTVHSVVLVGRLFPYYLIFEASAGQPN